MDKDMIIDLGVSFVLTALRSIKGQKGDKLKAAKAKAKPWVLKIIKVAREVYADDPDFE